MIQPYMVGMWIGLLCLVMSICFFMDMITPDREEDVEERNIRVELTVDDPQDYLSKDNDYDDVNIYEEDKLIEGD